MDSNDETTFLDETVKYMDGIKEQPEDVEFIGSKDRRICLDGWDEFKKASGFRVDSIAHVMSDLIIAFEDGTVMFRVKDEDRERWDHIRGAGYMGGRKVFHLPKPGVSAIEQSTATFYDLYKKGLEEESRAEVNRKIFEFR